MLPGITGLAGFVQEDEGGNFFNNVTALLHFDGVDEGTIITDNSNSANVYTAFDGAKTDSENAKFGPTSLLTRFIGYVSTPYNANDFEWSAGDFTVECWVRTASFNQSNGGFSQLLGCMSNTTGSLDWSFGPVLSGALKFSYNSGSLETVTSLNGVMTLNTWHHIAMCLDGSVIRLYVDGVPVASDTINGSPQSGLDFIIGRFQGQSYNGWVDDLRITKGVARYPDGTTFIPPTKAFPNA